jgi:hypothetical protein
MKSWEIYLENEVLPIKITQFLRHVQLYLLGISVQYL